MEGKWPPCTFFDSGVFRPPGGQSLVGSFIDTGQPNRVLGATGSWGVYRSQSGLYAAKAHLRCFRGLILMCGLAVPVSLLLMYYTYHLAQRDQVRAEEANVVAGAIVHDSEDAIFSETFQGVITSWNAGAERLFGYPEARRSARRAPN